MTSTDRSSSHLTPQQRLALSRRALVRQLHGGSDAYDDEHLASGQGPNDDLEYAQRDPSMQALPHGERGGHAPGIGAGVWLSMGRSVAQRWWRRHPAHALGQLARPLLERYARKKPAKLMAIAAATGAVVVLVKPWRLLSVTAVLAAVLKTSDMADVVSSLMQKNQSPPRKDLP